LRFGQRHVTAPVKSKLKIYPSNIAKECHPQIQGDRYHEKHISDENGSMFVVMLSSTDVKDNSCRLKINKKREDYPAELYTSQGKNHRCYH
jgi:hypothetical protein